MRYILRPEEIPEWCSLIDALVWMGMRLYPGYRYDPRVFDASDPIHNVLVRAEELRSFASATKITYSAALDALFGINQNSKPLQDDEAEMQEWLTQLHRLTELVEPHRAELYLLLRHGDLIGRGVRTHAVKVGSAAGAWALNENLVEIDAPVPVDPFLDDPVEIIPAEHWRLAHINWDDGIALGPNGRYGNIRLPCDKLFSRYPEPEVEVIEAQSRGGAIFAEFEPSSPVSDPNKRRRGRPRGYDWDAFQQKVTVIAHTEGLPDKQEVLVSRLLDWCQQEWGVEPASSTVKKYLQPIYSALKKADNSER